MRQCPRAHDRQREGLDGGERGPDAGAPTLSARPGTGQLFSIRKSQGGAGGHQLVPEEHEEPLGPVNKDHHRQEVSHPSSCGGLLMQYVHVDRREHCQKLLGNKDCPASYQCCSGLRKRIPSSCGNVAPSSI